MMGTGYLDFSTDLIEAACRRLLKRIHTHRRRNRAAYVAEYVRSAWRVWSWMGFDMRRWAIQSYYDNCEHLEFLLQEALCKKLLYAVRLHRLAAGDKTTSKMFITAEVAERIHLGDVL